MKTIEDFEWSEMWSNAIEGSRWGQRAGMPEFWDERVDWFEELVRQSDRAGMIMERTEVEPGYRVLDIVAGRRNEKEGSSLWSLFNREKHGLRPDYIYLYNILYQLGIYANVEIIDANHNMQFPDLDAAVQHYKSWMNVSRADEERLRLYLSENLVKENDAFWLRHKLRTAMISWRKDMAKV